MITETINVPNISHIVKPITGGFQTRDYLVDQTQAYASSPPGLMNPILNTNLAENKTYSIHIVPPPGSKFRLNFPIGQQFVLFRLNLGRIVIYSHDGQAKYTNLPPISQIFKIFNKFIAWHLSTAQINFVNLQTIGRIPSIILPQVGYFEKAAGIFLKADVLFYASATFDEIIIEGQYAPPSYPPKSFFDYYPAMCRFGSLLFLPNALFPDPYVFFTYNLWTSSPKEPGRFVDII